MGLQARVNSAGKGGALSHPAEGGDGVAPEHRAHEHQHDLRRRSTKFSVSLRRDFNQSIGITTNQLEQW
eukprot:2782825-Pleurochrysis_carterae.AAC.1